MASSFGTAVKDEDENVNDDVIEMGQDAQPEPEPVP